MSHVILYSSPKVKFLYELFWCETSVLDNTCDFERIPCVEIIYVRLRGSKKGRHLRLGIKYQIENQNKSKNDLCEFIVNKVELCVIDKMSKVSMNYLLYFLLGNDCLLYRKYAK